jgi:hypothetical protein
MIDPKELLIEVLRAKDATRSRSVQTQVGPSELGGCRRKVWYRLNSQVETNDNELKLAAIMGTAIHATIEEALALADPTGEKYVVESEVEYNGMKAHIDLWIPETGAVVDWKTSKIKNLSYFPSKQQRWQVQTYGYLLEKSGLGNPKTVNLVAIARDGDERDVKIHSEAYDPAIGEEALAWLEEIKKSSIAPDPEKDASYCKFYCKYYDSSGELGCVGIKKELTKPSDIFIDDPEVDSNALLFLQLGEQIDELTDKRDSLRTTFEGVIGRTASGVELSWTTVAGRQSIDEKEVEKLLGFIPKKEPGKESTRLNIKLAKGE